MRGPSGVRTLSGMELDALDRMRSVAHAHDLAVLRPRGHLQLRGNANGGERVVAAGLERGREPREDAAPVVLEHARLAVQQRLRLRHLAAEGLDDRLMAETDAQRRESPGRAGG